MRFHTLKTLAEKAGFYSYDDLFIGTDQHDVTNYLLKLDQLIRDDALGIKRCPDCGMESPPYMHGCRIIRGTWDGIEREEDLHEEA